MNRLSYFLIASLALNGVLGGMTLARFARPLEDMPLSVELPEGLEAAWMQLPESERASLRQELRVTWANSKEDRKLLEAARREVAESARAEPYDETRMRAAVAAYQRREWVLAQRAEDILIRHIGNMPAAARETAAVGLLTPLYSQVKQRDREVAAVNQAPAPEAP